MEERPISGDIGPYLVTRRANTAKNCEFDTKHSADFRIVTLALQFRVYRPNAMIFYDSHVSNRVNVHQTSLK